MKADEEVASDACFTCFNLLQKEKLFRLQQQPKPIPTQKKTWHSRRFTTPFPHEPSNLNLNNLNNLNNQGAA